ncbi:MAG: serine protease [Patescibacteria group bacterium]
MMKNVGIIVFICTLVFVALSSPPQTHTPDTEAVVATTTPTETATTTTVAEIPFTEEIVVPLADIIQEPAPLKTKSPEKPLIHTPLTRPEPAPTAQETVTSSTGTPVTRLQNPYSFPKLSSESINVSARAGLVNILCTNPSNGQSTSGSGVVIDRRGVVLTNAHIAQFVLLAEVSNSISCTIRTGSPATSQFEAQILFLPNKWVAKHAKDLRVAKPTGTGEDDYALVLAVPIAQGTPLPSPIPFDTREGVIFERDPVLLASYPAGFLGNFFAQNDLYPASTFTTIKKLYTFGEASIDLLSLGGVIIAQGGSSGGAVVNEWGRLVGIIVTSSDAATTEARDLRSVTVAHINRSLREHTGQDLTEYLSGDILEHGNIFRVNDLPALAKELVDALPHTE